MDQKMALLRSWMFVPGDRQRMIDKSMALPVDAILMDIEDGVAPEAKETARRQIAASLDQVEARKKENPSLRTPARYVRINAVGHERMHADHHGHDDGGHAARLFLRPQARLLRAGRSPGRIGRPERGPTDRELLSRRGDHAVLHGGCGDADRDISAGMVVGPVTT